MNKKQLSLIGLLLASSLTAAAQDAPGQPSSLENPVALLLLAVIVGLFVAIAVLGSVVIQAMEIYRERMKKEQGNTVLLVTGILLTGSLFSTPAAARDAVIQAPEAPVSTTISGLASTTFYALTAVITVELLVMVVLLWALRVLTGISLKRTRAAAATATGKPVISWWEKMNRTRTVDAATEQSEDMGHDFDGIRELNNPTPPWWKWGFISSAVFAVVYLWVYHVAQSAPLQLQELAIAEEKAAAEKTAYLAHAANNVDEHSVKLLTEAGELASGQKLFSTNCAPCHGAAGQGVVGPNLTDNYWLHGGKINAIFSTIKYGVPDKGMKSWKDDFSPNQIAQLASYIKSIHDTHPAGAKEPQGVPE